MVAIKIESAAVEVFAARARHDVDSAVAGHAGREIEVDRRELKLLHGFLGYLQAGADCANEIDVSTVYGHAGESDARRGLHPSTKQRHKDAVVRASNWIRHARFELGKIEKIASIERQVFDLLAADDAAYLMAFIVD